jgi:hypothetical protein
LENQVQAATARRVTKPKIFDEAIHFRAVAGTKARLDRLRGETRQGDFVRELIEKALSAEEKEQANGH